VTRNQMISSKISDEVVRPFVRNTLLPVRSIHGLKLLAAIFQTSTWMQACSGIETAICKVYHTSRQASESIRTCLTYGLRGLDVVRSGTTRLWYGITSSAVCSRWTGNRKLSSLDAVMTSGT